MTYNSAHHNRVKRKHQFSASTDYSSKINRMRLVQLMICISLFLLVFIGKGIFPQKLIQIREDVLSMLTDDMDFRAVISALGETNSEKSVVEQLESFCTTVFGIDTAQIPSKTGQKVPETKDFWDVQSKFLSGNPSKQDIAEHLLYLNALKIPIPETKNELPTDASSEPSSKMSEEEAIPTAGTLVLKSDYSGQPLPKNYTMDQLSLGALKTEVPVLGYINSEYGYRKHPIYGTYQFHGGVDISGKMGDVIHAFADGTVEYVGQDDSYGLYTQLDHGNGVKSFYAHCSSICVSKGQKVVLGEKIGEVGSTGVSTGPHLHLELKYNKMHLNPIYYIEYLTKQ